MAKISRVGYDMKEFDNILVEGLFVLLNENTTLKRFYPLIPCKKQLVAGLKNANIKDKYEFIDDFNKDNMAMSLKSGLALETLGLLKSLFQLYDFKDRRLSDISSIDNNFIDALIKNGVNTSGKYLSSISKEDGVYRLVNEYAVSIDVVTRVACICDLMRLPGVKELRANLYFDCGYKTVKDFSVETWESMRQTIDQHIQLSGSSKSLPLPKELATQIAVAKVIPYVLSFS